MSRSKPDDSIQDTAGNRAAKPTTSTAPFRRASRKDVRTAVRYALELASIPKCVLADYFKGLTTRNGGEKFLDAVISGAGGNPTQYDGMTVEQMIDALGKCHGFKSGAPPFGIVQYARDALARRGLRATDDYIRAVLECSIENGEAESRMVEGEWCGERLEGTLIWLKQRQWSDQRALDELRQLPAFGVSGWPKAAARRGDKPLRNSKSIKPRRRRERHKRTEPTTNMMKAYARKGEGCTYRAIAKELGMKSPTTIGNWIKCVERFLKPTRSVRATEKLPEDRRGNVNLSE